MVLQDDVSYQLLVKSLRKRVVELSCFIIFLFVDK